MLGGPFSRVSAGFGPQDDRQQAPCRGPPPRDGAHQDSLLSPAASLTRSPRWRTGQAFAHARTRAVLVEERHPPAGRGRVRARAGIRRHRAPRRLDRRTRCRAAPCSNRARRVAPPDHRADGRGSAEIHERGFVRKERTDAVLGQLLQRPGIADRAGSRPTGPSAPRVRSPVIASMRN